jgi:hypothetical protein
MDPQLHARLSRLVGTWCTEGRIIDGGEQHGQTWGGHDIYEWFPRERQLVHRVDVQIFGGRKESIEIFTPREGSPETFDQTSFDADGSVEHAVGSFDAEGRYHNDLDEVRAMLTFEGDDAARIRWEMRGADNAWADWMDVRLTRVAAPHIEIRSKDDHIR